MCGLIGFSGKTKYNKKYIQLLIAWNSLERGEDSTGLYTPLNGTIKKLERGSEFVLHAENDFVLDNLFIGHVRAKTIGTNIEKNAHPFHRGNIVLAHNGTLKNHLELLRKYKLPYADYNVDSDVLCGALNVAGNYIPFKEINGPAAVLFHNTDTPENLYVFKGTERTLFRGVDNKGNMYISSLEEPLYFLGLYNIKPFKDNTLYTIKDGNITKTISIKNEPLMPVVYNLPTNNTDYYKYLWMRANNSFSKSINNLGQGSIISITKDTYYRCLINEGTEIQIVGEDGVIASVPHHWMNQNDVIRVGDYVMVYVDTIPNRNNAKIIGVKGDIFKVTHVYFDGDLGCDTIDSKISTGFIKKDLVRKLTKTEFNDLVVEMYNNRNIPAPFQIPPTVLTIPESTIPIYTGAEENDIEIIEEVINDPDEMLLTFLTELDDKLENLNTAAVTSITPVNVSKQITELLDFVTNSVNDFFAIKT